MPRASAWFARFFPGMEQCRRLWGSPSLKKQKSGLVCGWGHFYTLLSAGHVPLQLGSSFPFLSGLWKDGPLSDAAIYSSSNTQVIVSGLFQKLIIVHFSPALFTWSASTKSSSPPPPSSYSLYYYIVTFTACIIITMVTFDHHHHGCYVYGTMLSTLHVSFTPWEVVSLLLFNSQMREVSSERLSNLPRVTQLAYARAGMLT